MALVRDDFVKETSTTVLTADYVLLGAATGFQSFATVGNTNTCYYSATDGADWEVGLGTYSTTGPTLARTTILASSNADAAVSWGAGTRTISLVYPASKAIQSDDVATVAVAGIIKRAITRRAITSGDTVIATDVGNIIDATSGTFTLAFTAAATLANGAWGLIWNTGTGEVTLNPDGAETIDGLTTFILYPGEKRMWHCDGSGFRTTLLAPGSQTYTATGTWTKPPGSAWCMLALR